MSTAATAPATESEPELDKKPPHPRDPAREVVETVVFVVVLVLLLKLFVTEAFVIPTGSMAETLYGYQKIIICPKCGHEFPVNATAEVDGVAPPGNPNGPKERHRLIGYCCPNCRHLGEVRDLTPSPDPKSGDRVLVLKPLYHLRPPHRGDVVVFKYPVAPQENHTAANYIKRAMGFGGETLAIHRGDLFVTTSLSYPDGNPMFPRAEDPLDLWQPKYMYPNSKHAEDLFAASLAAGFTDRVPGGFQIVRKNEDHMLADRRIVWDNDKQPRELVGQVPPRWEIVGGPGRWNADNLQQPRAFSHSGGDLDWLRYQHLTWTTSKQTPDEVARGTSTRRVPWRWTGKDGPKPFAGPIDNMLGYNAGVELDQKQNILNKERGDELWWVGDLILECEVELSAGSEVVLELSKGENRFQAKFGNGEVSLARVGPGGAEFGNPTRPCKVRAGTHKLRFANVDCRLWVWVDEKRIDFGTEGDYSPTEPTTYDPDDKAKEGWTRANDVEAPARIGAKGPVAKVTGIKLFRDVYYTRTGNDQSEAAIYYVQPGHYMCLGDNSAQSSDSRSWGTVPERLMLGKAVFVFFPVGRLGFIK